MPITLLDIILIGVMLISGLLAMIRGFMREILSIAAWVIAAVATLYFYAKLLPYAKSYFNNDIVAAGVVVGGTFLITLLIISVMTVRFSDMVLDSRIGALDRTLGFLFGLVRNAGYENAGRLGALAAAEVIQHIGARPQVSLKQLAQQNGLPV